MDGEGRTTAFGGRSGTELCRKRLFIPKEGYPGLDDLQVPASEIMLGYYFPPYLSRRKPLRVEGVESVLKQGSQDGNRFCLGFFEDEVGMFFWEQRWRESVVSERGREK